MKRFYPSQPMVGVGAVIVCKGKILLEKRKGEPGRGKWSIPGGLVELGERAAETVVREVREETNLNVEKPELIDVVDSISLDESGRVKYHFVIVDYFVRLKGGNVKAADDAAELKWVPFNEVEEYDLTKTFKVFFQRNRGKLEKFSSCS